MLPLYASRNLSIFQSNRNVRRIEVINYDFRKPTLEVEISQCEKLLECICLRSYELSPKILTYRKCDNLFNFDLDVEFSVASMRQLMAPEEVLKLVFNEAFQASSSADFVVPTLSCCEISLQTEVDVLGEEGSLAILEEAVTQSHMFKSSATSDPLSAQRIEAIFAEDCNTSSHSVDIVKELLEQLAAGAAAVTHQRRVLDSIPLPCTLDWFVDSPGSRPICASLCTVEPLLMLKEVSQPMLVFQLKGGDFTDRLLRRATRATSTGSVPAVLDFPSSKSSLLHSFRDILPAPAPMPLATFCGEVGLILPDLATERPSSAQGPSTGIMSALGLQVLREVELLRTTTLFTAQPRAFLYDTRNQPLFGGIIQRLTDLQSPHELMPVRHRPERTENPVVLLIAETLQELHLEMRSLSPRRLASRPSPVHPSALTAWSLCDGDLPRTETVPTKRRKLAPGDANDRTSVAESALGVQAREFVRFAALGAVPDEEPTASEPDDIAAVLHKRKHAEIEAAAPTIKQLKASVETTSPSLAVSIPIFARVAAPSSPQEDGTTGPAEPVAAAPLAASQADAHLAPVAPPPPLPTDLPETRPSFQFNLNLGGAEDMVEQYLRLQRGEGPRSERSAPMVRGAGSSASQVTPPRMASSKPSAPAPAPAPALPPMVAQVTPARISEAEAVRLRIQQLSIHNTSAFHAAEHPLTMLISESFLVEYFPGVAANMSAIGVAMVDSPLQEPVSIVLDHLTAVCVVSAVTIQEKSELKMLVKSLSEITFKFTKITVLVMLDREASATKEESALLNQALLTLTQAVSRFPAAVNVRQCSSSSPAELAGVLGQLCVQSLREAVSLVPTGASARHFHRPFLDRLQHCDAKHLAHCEYLQLFPTLNFYTAAALLHSHPLRELVGQRAGALGELFSRQYVCSEDLRGQLKAFVALLEVHAGLELRAE